MKEGASVTAPRQIAEIKIERRRVAVGEKLSQLLKPQQKGARDLIPGGETEQKKRQSS